MDWDTYFLQIADTVRRKSKDPSTKVGAVIVRDHRILATGFNGFARGIDETDLSRWERPEKYLRVVHAERNAIYNAAREGTMLLGSTLYLFGMELPCIDCANGIIQAGIIRIVGRKYKRTSSRWVDNLQVSEELLAEACVLFQEVQ